MNERKGTPKDQTPSKAADTVLKNSPLYELYLYLTLVKDNIPGLCGASEKQLPDIADQLFQDLNDLQLSILKLPPDVCFTTKPLLLPISPRQRFSLTPNAQCVFTLFKDCLEQAYTHLEAAPEEEKSYPEKSSYSVALRKNIEVYATARRLFHCLTHTLSKQPLFLDNEASIPDFLHIISTNLIARLPYERLLTGVEKSCLVNLIMNSPQDWATTFQLTCPGFNSTIICCPLEDAIQLGWRRGIMQLVAAGHQLLGGNSLYKATGRQSEFPGWTLYQVLLTTPPRHKAIRATLSFFPSPIVNIVCEYSEEEKPTSSCNLM